MLALSSTSQPHPSRGFYRLVVTSAVLTFVLIVLGTVVRVSDSGLGCGPGGSGVRGWPLCGGGLLPAIDTHAVLEYLHRATAGAVATLIVVLAFIAWRRYRRHRRIKTALAAAVGAVMAQSVLGGLTVEKGLSEPLVTAHLGIAMALFALLIYVSLTARPQRIDRVPRATTGMRALVAAAAIALFLAIVSGGYMSATQRYGTPDYRPGEGAHMACGNTFPKCSGSLLPYGHGRLTDIHVTHRAFMYLASLLILIVFMTSAISRRNQCLLGLSGLMLALLVIQVLLGALNVWEGERAWLITLHLAVGTLLWGSLVAVVVRAWQRPALDGTSHHLTVAA